MSEVTLHPPAPGDLGWIVQAHGDLYAREHGFDRTFEGLVAEIVADFVRANDAAGERCWIARRDGARVGCVLVARREGETAQLRCLLVDPGARGLGIGRRLVDVCVSFAREAGYRRMMLWTVDILHDARRLYEGAGFTCVEATPEPLFGRSLVSQRWERTL